MRLIFHRRSDVKYVSRINRDKRNEMEFDELMSPKG